VQPPKDTLRKNTANNIHQQTNKTSTFSGTSQKSEAPTALLQRASKDY
jgi:hypothetical protein